MPNRFVSISFQSGIKQEVPSTLLPAPLLTKASNLIIKDTGRLESRPTFKQLSGAKLPAGSGRPLKLFVRNNQLFCITDKNILSYQESDNRWEDFVSRLSDLSIGSRRNMSLNTFPITQKETDIKTLAFSHVGSYMVFFYTYDNPSDPVGTVYYKIWSLADQRVVGDEQSFPDIEGSQRVTGLFAQSDGRTMFLGVADATNVRVFEVLSLFPFSLGRTWSPPAPIPAIQRFVLHKDRIFYTTDGSRILSAVFDPRAVEKSQVGEITTIRDPYAHSRDFGGNLLYDFFDWTDFSFGDPLEQFKIVWSVQTGYFIVNQRNRLVAHLYSNFTPFSRPQPPDLPRMAYSGEALLMPNNRVYVPILRSGQPEVVNRDAITDRIVPRGQELVVFRPLGLELLELDLSSLIPPQHVQIDQQSLISGPLLLWTDGQSVSEYSFAEKPVIELAPGAIYDRWPYPELEQEAPSFADISQGNINSVNLTMAKKSSPYLVNQNLSFTPQAGQNVAWGSGSTLAERTLRFGTTAGTRDASSTLGLVATVYYDSSLNALVMRVTGSPLPDLKNAEQYPQMMKINGLKYIFQQWIKDNANTLRCLHYTTNNPLVVGTSVSFQVPFAESIVSTAISPNTIQQASSFNQQTKIQLDRVQLNRFFDRMIDENPRASVPISNAQAGFALLNGFGDRGAISSGVREIPSLIRSRSFGSRDSSKDITINTRGLPTTSRRGLSLNIDIASIGDNFWIPDNFGDYIYGFSFATGQGLTAQTFDVRRQVGSRRQTWGLTPLNSDRMVVLFYHIDDEYWYFGEAIRRGLVVSSWTSRLTNRITDPSGICNDGNVVWILNSTDGGSAGYMYAYNPTGSQRLSSEEFSLSGISGRMNDDFLKGCYCDGTTIWVGNNSDDKIYAFYRSTKARDESKDIDISGHAGIDGFFKRGDYLYVYDGNNLYAYYVGAETPANGTISSPTIQDGISFAGIWTTGDGSAGSGALYLVFSGPSGSGTSQYATPQALDQAIQRIMGSWRFKIGEGQEYTYPLPVGGILSANKRTYTRSNVHYVRYEIPNFSNIPLLRENIFNASLLTTSRLNISFWTKAGINITDTLTPFENDPQVLSALFSGFDENDTAKRLMADDINPAVRFLATSARANLQVNQFDRGTFKVFDTNKHYMETTNDPLNVNSAVFNFENLIAELVYEYPLVAVDVSPTAAELLSATVYNYLCRFKWQDDAGLEHRSQYSEIVQIVSNNPIGQVGNQPTFNVRHLNLTNKKVASVAIEIYRTKNRATTFQFLKEVTSDQNQNTTQIVDDVEDNRLGAPVGPNNVLISGAKFVTAYKGRFVLYGFPDKPNRVVVSSPRQPFSNTGIQFRQSNLPGDLIEILMEQAVKNIRALDNYLLIFCEDKAFVWTINEGSLRQTDPVPVTGLSRFTADDFNASIEVTEGVLFNAKNGLGIHLVTRGLSWKYEGEPVKNIWTSGKLLDACRKSDSEDIVFLKDKNIISPQEPEICVYNQQYRQWTTYSDRNLVSCVIWGEKFTGLTRDGEIFQEETEERQETERFMIQTGWMQFKQAFMSFQRIREISVLMSATGLTGFQMRLDYDFIEGGPKSETLVFDISGAVQTIGGVTIPLEQRKEWRFQNRNQQCSAIRIQLDIVAKAVMLDALRVGGDWGPGISGQSHKRGGV